MTSPTATTKPLYTKRNMLGWMPSAHEPLYSQITTNIIPNQQPRRRRLFTCKQGFVAWDFAELFHLRHWNSKLYNIQKWYTI